MSYAGSLTAGLLRAATLGRTSYLEGKEEGSSAVAKSAAAAREERRKELLAQAQAAVAERTAGLVDPNTPESLAGKNKAAASLHAENRLFDVKNPTRDMSGSTPGSTDKVAQRARQAYKAKLMAPDPQLRGPPRPGMTETEAEELATAAYGPPDGSVQGPNTSTRSLMGGSILRGGGAATPQRGAARSATPAPARTGDTDLSNSSAQSTGANLKERDLSAADLWDKKVEEGMNPEQATAYVHRLKGTG